jgi:hypothetical protein
MFLANLRLFHSGSAAVLMPGMSRDPFRATGALVMEDDLVGSTSY